METSKFMKKVISVLSAILVIELIIILILCFLYLFMPNVAMISCAIGVLLLIGLILTTAVGYASLWYDINNIDKIKKNK